MKKLVKLEKVKTFLSVIIKAVVKECKFRRIKGYGDESIFLDG